MSKIIRSVTVEQHTTSVSQKWEFYYRVVKTINVTNPKINEELSEEDVSQLINHNIKVTVKQVS